MLKHLVVLKIICNFAVQRKRPFPLNEIESCED